MKRSKNSKAEERERTKPRLLQPQLCAAVLGEE